MVVTLRVRCNEKALKRKTFLKIDPLHGTDKALFMNTILYCRVLNSSLPTRRVRGKKMHYSTVCTLQ